MPRNDIICFDWETGSRNPYKTQPTQLAAIAIHGRTLRPKGIFNSEIRPILDDAKAIELGFDPIENEALIKTNKNREDLAKAPELPSVWAKFVDFANQYNYKGTSFFAPIPAGHNILNFDMIIVERMCQMFGPINKSTGRQGILHHIYKIDLMDNYFLWTEGDPSIQSIGMDSIREKMGISGEGAHEALKDVKDIANVMISLLKTHRAVYKNLKLDKAFANGFYID